MISPYIGNFKVTSPQGNRVLNGKSQYHDGLDLVGLDSKEIHSTINGTVKHAGWENSLNHKQGFGLYVSIEQEGSVNRYYFGHMSEIRVKAGQKVTIGQVIGIEGNTGYSTGPHCHYCVRGNGSKSQVKDVSAISGIPNAKGTYYCEDYTSDNNNTPVTAAPDVIYQIWDDVKNKWLPNVTNDSDYAGLLGHDVCGVYANLTYGNIYYAVHTTGKKARWLPEVKNRNDYAGIYNTPIDAIMIKTDTDKTLKYRVHLRGGNWLPPVTGYNKNDSNNGYAGIIGKPIDAIQIWFE